MATSGNSRNQGSYTVNQEYEILHASGVFNHIDAKYLIHQKCYEAFRKNHSPCPDCPVKLGMMGNESSIRQPVFNHVLNNWLDCTLVSLKNSDEGECTLISFTEITEENRRPFQNFNQATQFDTLIELNVAKNRYRFLHYDSAKMKFSEKGNLSALIEELCFRYVHPKDQQAFLAFWNRSTLKQRVIKIGNISGEFRILSHEDHYHWVSFIINYSPKMTNKEVFLCYIMNIDDKYYEQRQEKGTMMTLLDPQSGLYVSQAFYRLCQERLRKEAESFVLIRIDIEHFMLFNDWYGTEEGDRLLKYLAGQLKKVAQEMDGIAARIGGDDFVLFMPAAQASKEWMEQLLYAWIQAYDPEVKFLPAAGIYPITDRSMSIPAMCDRATLALNTIRGNYAQRVAYYHNHMKQKLSNEQAILFDVKKGLEREEFEVYLQPYCSARTNRIIGAEALVRWNHPEKGMIAPDEFIPILETSGFIATLDYYVWEHVCQFQQQCLLQKKAIIPISVNVSRMDLYQFQITEVFLELIKRYDLSSNLIEIEITESAYAEDFAHLSTEIKKLREAGFIVLMDDFGSGYSSLNMLKDIEIDVLKIDMKFLEMNAYSTKRSTGILESIIQMGKWLGLRLIAEGVEKKQQVDSLLNLDCEYMQGYFFYRPMPMEQFMQLLENAEKIDERGILAKRLPSINLDDLFHKDITSEGMLSNILGGIALYEIEEDSIRLKMVNDMYYRMTGCNSVDLEERKNHIIKQVHPDDLAAFWDIFQRAQHASSQGASGIFRRYRLNGEVMWMHLHAFYLRRQGNKKIFYGSVSDYTKIVKMQEKMDTLIQNTPGDVFSIEHGTLIYHNYNLAKILGYTIPEYKALVERPHGYLPVLVDERDREKIQSTIEEAFAHHADIDLLYRSLDKQQELHYFHLKASYTGNIEGDPLYYGIIIDATAAILKERELKISQEMFKSVIHQAGLDIWEYDLKEDTMMFSEESAHQLCKEIPSCFQQEQDTYVLQHFTEIMKHKKYFCDKAYHILDLMMEKIRTRNFEESMFDLSVFEKNAHWLKMTCEGIYDEEGALVKIIGYFQDITELIEREVVAEEEKKYAQFDSLTGIYNRRMGEILIQNALAERQNNNPSALMMIDLDDFKHINDSYGHIAGDHVLQFVTTCIKECINSEDIFCRLGGDEFILFAQRENFHQIETQAQQLLDCMKTCALKDQDKKGRVSLSIGIAISPEDGDTLNLLYQKADEALYQAKTLGKTQYHVYQAC